MRVTPEVTLPLALDRASSVTLVDQLVGHLRALLHAGVLRPGDPLPSTRALAAHLGTARGTVLAAYDQLLAEGWFEAAAGRATRVNPRLADVHPQGLPTPTPAGATSPPTEATKPLIDLRPGRPHQADLASAAWRAAWRRAADEPLDVSVPVLGWPPLRAAIAEHLRRMRAVVVPLERIAVTAGGREGLALLLAATAARSVGVEDPGYPSLRRVLARAGVHVVPLAADDHGLQTSALPADAPDVVIVTPSHQYPLGGSLPIDRRQALLAWAAERGVLIVEDDYDAQLRYTSQPLPALTALDALGHTALLGTFASTLTPALATGFVVVPPRLLDAVAQARADLGTPVSLVTQRAVGHFLAAGALDRHTQRMRNLYRRRRAEVVRGLRGLDGVRVSPMDGGLHAVVETRRDEQVVIAELAAHGVAVAGLSDYWASRTPRGGIVFGFGGGKDAELTAALAVIARVVRA